jgi:hypothetical protein
MANGIEPFARDGRKKAKKAMVFSRWPGQSPAPDHRTECDGYQGIIVEG